MVRPILSVLRTRGKRPIRQAGKKTRNRSAPAVSVKFSPRPSSRSLPSPRRRSCRRPPGSPRQHRGMQVRSQSCRRCNESGAENVEKKLFDPLYSHIRALRNSNLYRERELAIAPLPHDRRLPYRDLKLPYLNQFEWSVWETLNGIHSLRRLYITSWALRSRVLSRAATDRGFP
jgi:hypothetical protein